MKEQGRRNDLRSNTTEVTQDGGKAYNLTRLKREWLPWCRENLRFGLRAGAKYMELYREKDKFAYHANLGIEEAYRLLSQPAGDGCGEAGESGEGAARIKYIN